jgi:hypothetical protein
MVRVLSVTQGDAHGGAEEKRQYVEKHPESDAGELRDGHAAPPFCGP